MESLNGLKISWELYFISQLYDLDLSTIGTFDELETGFTDYTYHYSFVGPIKCYWEMYDVYSSTSLTLNNLYSMQATSSLDFEKVGLDKRIVETLQPGGKCLCY